MCCRTQDGSLYPDVSLKLHDTVYPAAGTDHSAVRLTIKELEECCEYPEWVDICKIPEGEGDRTLEYWRSVHEPFFKEELAAINQPFDGRTKVVCEEFEVVFSS